MCGRYNVNKGALLHGNMYNISSPHVPPVSSFHILYLTVVKHLYKLGKLFHFVQHFWSNSSGNDSGENEVNPGFVLLRFLVD